MHNRLFRNPSPTFTQESKPQDSRDRAGFPPSPAAVRPSRSSNPLRVSRQSVHLFARGAARYLLCFALLLGLLPANLVAPTPLYAAPNACPASPSGLPDVIERTEFCVYYDDADTTDDQATTVADQNQAYWDLYTSAAFGFLDPAFTDKLVIEIFDNSSCNGGTSPSSNDYNINNGCFGASAESVQQTVGHELFHRVQYSYHGTEVRWFKEGTARAMEDLAFTNIDHWANALMAPFSFNLQANTYLNNSNVDITTDPQRYNSALWWKYFTEQFGTVVTEPQRGVDAMVALWNAAITQDDIAAINSALSTLGAGVNFDSAFRRFAAANYIKDLTNQPHPTHYNYIDEDEASSPGVYGPVVPTSGGSINLTTPVNFNNQALNRYGARYYRADPSATNCPVVSATFHTDAGPAFYHVVTQKGNAVDSFASSTSTDFARSFFNDGLTRIVAVAGATNNSAQADIAFTCVNPVINIVMPNDVAVAHVGPAAGPGKFLVHVQVHNGDLAGPVVAGLTTNDFKAKVGVENALITAGGFIQQQYWLVVQAPVQEDGDGLYDLEITLEKSGTADVIATDTNVDSISYLDQNIDNLLIIDRSGSMLSDNKMVAARSAAKFYVDITRNGDGVGVVPYNEDVNPAPFDLVEVNATVRNNAKTYIDGITASGLTSIGDGLAEAVDQLAPSPTSNPACSFVLLSDGMQNQSQFWVDVDEDVIATGCPVTAIALGGATDETLMQNIATATGGIYFYNDVFTGASAAGMDAPDAIDAAADTALDLGNVYEYSQAESEDRQRVLAEKSIIDIQKTDAQTHTVMIDASMTEALFALDWVSGISMRLRLFKPDGSEYDEPYSFSDFGAGHVGWRVGMLDLMPGAWQMVVDTEPNIIESIPSNAPDAVDSPAQSSLVPYQVLVSGPSDISIQLLLPAILGTRYTTGQKVPIYALISHSQPISGLLPIAQVTSPDGSVRNIPLFDDGDNGDGEAGDGLYGGFFTAVNQALAVPPTGEPTTEPTPNDEGSYRVKLLVDGGTFTREALGSFSVEEGADTNSDGMPDVYEEENDITGDGADPDLDQLPNADEYDAGTDPNHSDTDGGGENDGSELNNLKDPFDPTDDEIVAPEFLVATPNIGFNVITYDVVPEYVQMILYRATSPDGPWSLHVQELPNTGIYSDTATNGTTYHYRYVGKDVDNFFSEVIGTTPATPSEDPFAPEAAVLVNSGAPTTTQLSVILTFVPSGHDVELFEDITEMRLSNDPTMAGAAYQPFAQDVPWELAPTDPGDLAAVYAQFKYEAGNDSLVVPGAIVVVASGPAPEFDTDIFLPSIDNNE